MFRDSNFEYLKSQDVLYSPIFHFNKDNTTNELFLYIDSQGSKFHYFFNDIGMQLGALLNLKYIDVGYIKNMYCYRFSLK